MGDAANRVIALVIAILFLATALGGGGIVLWQLTRPATKSDSQAEVTPPKTGNRLAGSKLANFTAPTKVDKLTFTDIRVGSGEVVKPGAKVVAHYTGAVASTGVIFQSSHDNGQPASFDLNGVIKGWTEGVPGMKAGGTRRLLIPAGQAYGDQPRPGSGIPPGADLVFDIELINVNNQ